LGNKRSAELFMQKPVKFWQQFYKLAGVVLILVLILAGNGAVFAAPGTADDSGLPRQKIRVGFFAFDGYHMQDAAGHKSGYGYELLQMLARYSNWDYEYVGYGKSWEEMQEMLAKGELDLLTSAQKTPDREERFAFSERPVGYSSIIFTTLPDNERFTAGDYASYNGARIGLLRGNSRNREFADYAGQAGFTFMPVYYDNAKLLVQALQSRQVDAIVSSNLRAVRNEWILNQFAPSPFYAMVRKGRPQLLFQLNNAITQLDIYQPEWRSDLWNRYYAGSGATSIPFSVRELAYLKKLHAENKVFTVVMDPENEPYSYFDKEGKPAGIFPEIFAAIAKQARIQYQILPTKSRQDYRVQLTSGKPDINLNAYFDYNEAEKLGYELTSPYWNTVLVQLLRKEYTGPVRTVASVMNLHLHTWEDKGILKDKTLRLYPDTDAALEAVRNATADAVYLYRYTAQTILRQERGADLQLLPLPQGSVGISLGINSRNDYRLAAILNKAVDSINNTNLADEVANKYTTQLLAPQPFSLRRYVDNHPAAAAGIAVLLAFILAGIYLFRQKSEAELKEREQMVVLQEALEVARQASQAKGAFLSNMSHEIRTPLNAILGYMNLARQPGVTPEQNQHFLNNSQLAATQLLQIINDVLDISAIESGRFKIGAAPFHLRQLLAQLTAIFVGQAANKGVRLETVIQSLELETLIGDQYRVNQILMNLLSNAVKFTPAGGQVRLTVSEMQPEPSQVMVKFQVTDSGIGMNQEFMQRIFKPFEQESATTVSRFGGTGLGLSICQNLVQLMHGSIVVDSKEGQGTTFTVTLPFKVETGPMATENLNKPEVLLPDVLAGFKVLLVEDNAMNREIAVSILEKLGLVVDTAEDGQVAVDKFRNSLPGTYQCILMDIQMPVLNGYEATQAIRSSSHAEASTIPIVALTADVFADDVARATACGMNGYVSKPLDYRKLIQVLLEVLGKAGTVKQ
jgi:signal transduction histidine kinase/ActR/RegA family two-component response regulator